MPFLPSPPLTTYQCSFCSLCCSTSKYSHQAQTVQKLISGQAPKAQNLAQTSLALAELFAQLLVAKKQAFIPQSLQGDDHQNLQKVIFASLAILTKLTEAK